jgi:hypothetical protein
LDLTFWRFSNGSAFYLLPVLKRFLKHIVLFGLPVFGLVLLIWAAPVSIEQRWNRLFENCSKSACIYNLTIKNKQNIDVAFVGSSRTMAAVKDSLLSKMWQSNVANLGYCRPGRNVQFEILKLLFTNHKPRVVFIEISQDEDWYGHFDFGNVASTQNVLASVKDKNPKFIRDVANNFTMKFDLFQRQNIFNQPYAGSNCRWGNWPAGESTADFSAILVADTNTISQRHTSELYLKKMVALCQKNGARVVFTYLPTFGLSGKKPNYLEFYLNYGTVVLDPIAFTQKRFWADASHLTPEAATFYSEYLAGACAKMVELK